jgi:hypothetical protein
MQLRCVLCAFVCLGLAATVVAEHAAKKTPWKIAGQLEEACLCNAPCPCWFDSLPTRMHCGGAQVVFIEKGRYGDVSLDGLSFAHYGQSPDGKTMMESFGAWDFSYLYLDERANAAQRKALEDISKTVMPWASSKNQKLAFVSIRRSVEGGEHKVAVGDHGRFAARLLDGGLGGASKIVNPPGADPLHHEYLQGRASQFVYNDAGQNWNTERTNYMLGQFEVNSEQYEKFAAGLAQKMAEMQKKND